MNNVETKLSPQTVARDGLSQARNLLLLMAKTLKSIKVYPENSPVIKGQKELLYREFGSFLAKNDVLTLAVAESGLRIDDQVVYEEQNRNKDLAFLLYRDGLRELSFYEGMTQEELNDFLEALAENWRGSEETDVVSSLWERDFRHISYVAIDEIFGNLMESAETGSEKNSPASVDLPSGAASQLSSGRIALEEEEVRQGPGGAQLAAGGERAPEPDDAPLLNEQDLRRIKEIVEEDKRDFNPPREFAQVLFDLLALEDEPDKYGSLIKVLEGYLSELIANAQFGTACEIFLALNEIQNSSSLQPAKYGTLVETILKVARSPESIEKIRQLLRKGYTGPWDDLLSYLSFLGPSTTPILVDLLVRNENPEVHSTLHELLVKFGRENPDYLGEWIVAGRAQLVKQIVFILGEAGERAIPHLERLIHHPDADVRKGVVRSLSRIGGMSVNPPLIKFLLDPDPAIRILAARGFSAPGPEVVGFVCHLIQQKGFAKKGLRERKAWVDILRKAGSPDAVATLGGLLYRRSWFRREENREFKAFVASALASIGTEPARKALREGMKVRKKEVSNACRYALQRWGGTKTEGETNHPRGKRGRRL